MSTTVTYVESLRSALHTTMEHDTRVVVLGEDILDPYGGAFKVTKGLSTRFRERVITTPICEATIVGAAVGMALRGLRPVAEIMFGDFIALAADQIINHAAKFHALYNGQVDVPLVVRTPMGGGRGYGPTHSQSLEQLFFGIPHLKVVAPSHVHDAGAMLQAAIADREPTLFIESKTLYPERLLLEPAPAGLERNQITGAHGYPSVILRNYDRSQTPDVTVIAYGGTSAMVAKVMMRLASEEVRILACLPGCLSPLDDEPILSCAQETGRVIVVEEGHAAFGWGTAVAARIYDALHGQLHGPVRRVGAAPTVIPAAKSLEEQVLVSPATIEAAILGALT